MSIHDHEAKRRRQTLDQLEGIVSEMPAPGDSSLVTKCLLLRKVPIGQFAVEDLRIMIGQREGLMFLIPLALEHLAADPLIEGNYFPGDLLCMVLRAGREFWQRHSNLRARLESVIAKLSDVPRPVAEALDSFQAAIT
jgi:hypothetical protein